MTVTLQPVADGKAAATRRQTHAQHDDDVLLDSEGERAFWGGKSRMTIHRWEKDPLLGYPPPDLEINGRKYKWRSTLLRFARDLAAKQAAEKLAAQQ